MIEIEAIGIDELLAALDNLTSDETIKAALRSAIPALGRINQSRQGIVARLPYSPKYIGKLKPSGRVRAGGEGDRGFSIDTGAFWNDVIGNWELDSLELVNFSDLVYAGRLAALAEGKGAAVYADDDSYLSVVEQELGTAVEAIWNV
jgi:hypothetical protein